MALSTVPTATFFSLLDTLREEQIRRLSQYRQLLSHQDQSLYELFRRFSTLLKICYREVDSIQLPELEYRCQTLRAQHFSEVMTIREPLFASFRESAERLIAQQNQGRLVDWKPLLNQLKESYFEYLKKEWAKFFTEKSEHSEEAIQWIQVDPTLYHKALFNAFHEVCLGALKPLVQDPKRGFHELLAMVLGLPTDYFLRDDAQEKLTDYTQWSREVKSHYRKEFYQVAGFWKKKEGAVVEDSHEVLSRVSIA